MELIENQKGQKILLHDYIGLILEEDIKCPIVIDPEIEKRYEDYELLFNEDFNKYIKNLDIIFKNCKNCSFEEKEICTKVRNIMKRIFQERNKNV